MMLATLHMSQRVWYTNSMENITRIADRPFIVEVINDTDSKDFTVGIHHNDCSQATTWVREYFGRRAVEYLCSDFDGNHTYRIYDNK